MGLEVVEWRSIIYQPEIKPLMVPYGGLVVIGSASGEIRGIDLSYLP